MEAKKYSTKAIINESIASCNGVYKKMLVSSLIQYVAFLVTYLLTSSLLISFIVYSIFLPSQVQFLMDAKNAKVDDVFKIKNKLSGYLILSMLFTFVFGLLSILLIFPVIIFMANYALVFYVVGKENVGVIDSLKQAREKVKGYRGKIAWLSVIFMFILILLVGFCMLVAWLFSLFTPMLAMNATFLFSFVQIPLFYYVGAFCGISLYLIFVLPIKLICTVNATKAIEQDKLYLEQETKDALNDETEKDELKRTEKHDDDKFEVAKEDSMKDTDDNSADDPSNYIF